MTHENLELSGLFGAFEPHSRFRSKIADTRASRRSRGGARRTEILNTQEVEKLTDSILQDYCDLNEWRVQRGLERIIEARMVEPALPILPRSPRIVVPNIKRNIEQIQAMGLAEKLEWRFALDSLIALDTYLSEEERMRQGKKPMPAQDFYPRVTGLPLRLKDTDWDDMEELRADLTRVLGRDFNYDFNPDKPASVRAALQSYQANTRIRAREDIENYFMHCYRPFKERLEQYLGVDLDPAKFDLKWVDRNRFYQILEYFSPTERSLEMNSNSRHTYQWSRGRINHYANHEPIHIFHPFLVMEGINDGLVDRVAGIYVMPGPASFQMEGMGLTVTDFIHPPMTKHGELANINYKLEKKAFAFASYRIQIDGVSRESAIAEIRDFAPARKLTQIDQLVSDALTDPMDRAFQGVIYNEGLDYFTEKRRTAENELQRKEEFSIAMTTPKTPAQFGIDTEPLAA